MVYRGRFAPSPTGPLHAGSLVAALGSWLDAKVQGGRWLVRIEDTDRSRCVAGADLAILAQLADCGLHPDEAPVWQSRRTAAYEHALQMLDRAGAVYRCTCSRRQIAAHWESLGRHKPDHGEWPYPGTCRERRGIVAELPQALRLRCGTQADPLRITWHDRRLGRQRQNLSDAVGDFILKRADGLWAYQLAVVVDDAAQGITDVVRGADLVDNTPRQIHLQRLLNLPTPRYLHTPLVLAADGEKLSKQNGAASLDTREPLRLLQEAGQHLGLMPGLGYPGGSASDWLNEAVQRWPVALSTMQDKADSIAASPHADNQEGTP